MPPPPTAPAVDRYLARLRARAAVFLAARAVFAAIGAMVVSLALGALGAGPLAPAWTIAIVWALAAIAAAAAAGWALQPLRELVGGGAARLVGRVRADLVSPLRTAFELGRAGGGPGASDTLVEAHARQLRGELARLPPSTVVPRDWLRHRAILGGLAAALAAVAIVALFDRAAGGAYALIHPGARDAAGAPIAAAFHGVQARLVFPAYLERPALVVDDPATLEVPPGTTVELRARTRIAANAAELEVAGATVRMEREGAGWRARFLARADGPVSMRLRGEDGAWVRDATGRNVRIVADEAPRVHLILPAEPERVVDGSEIVSIAFRASDDVGVVSADLVIRGADQREQRRRVATPESPQLDLDGDDTIRLADLGAEPGDRVEIWIEAHDGDDVGGPHTGSSEHRVLVFASAATRRAESLADLEALVDRAIATLADRLELPPPDEEVPARARFDVLRASTQALVSALQEFAERESGTRSTDAVLFREAAIRVRRLSFEEQRLHGNALGALAARQRVDERAIAELEDDVLLLVDLLERARIDDAAAIARELESLRREIGSLLRELRRANTPEARAALLAAIARAQQRLEDLVARMGAMGTSIPEEFRNAQQQEARETQQALDAMREAVERGDLEAAAEQLTRLEQQIDALARALGSSETQLSEERFGPRERALADALDRLMGLEAEQRELARRTAEVRSAAARRALDAAGERATEAARRLSGRAQQVRQALSPIEGERLSSLEQDALEAVVQRLRDTEDALSTGDLGEASRMVESAEDQLGTLARDLELDAMMFPGHDGQTARAARAASAGERQLRELRASLEEALPDLGDHVGGEERGRMRSDAPRQRTARGAAGSLAESFAAGPDGTPLAPDAAESLRAIGELMDEGARGLDATDPASATRAQEDAARRLTELREQIEQDMQRSAGGGGGQDGSATSSMAEDVRIHEADEFAGPMELRRRLLDAMHEAPPTGYEESVQRYYEGLLR